jgi:hypothetical protein
MTENLMSITEYCGSRDISRKSFYEHKRAGRLKGCFRRKPGGKRQYVIASKADRAFAQNVRDNRGGQATKRKHRGDALPETPPETEAEIKSYLDESIGDLAGLSIGELQRRNELEKLLLAQIKRRKESGELIDAELVERQAFEAGRSIRDAVQAIPDRTAPLLAAESEPFQIKQILNKEIYHVLENLAETIRITPEHQK